MADDVYDSWEDIIENGNMKILPRSSVSSPAISSLANSSSSSSSTSNGECSTFKILKRPTGDNCSSASTTQVTTTNNNAFSNNEMNNSVKRYDLQKYVNSQPFIPQNYQTDNGNCNNNSNNPVKVLNYPQIQFEDNTRTQYVKQVKILKRPSKSEDNKISPSKSNGNMTGNNNGSAGGKQTSQMKTYEEREAEYRLARLRILGSAKPTYENDSLNGTSFESSSYTCRSTSGGVGSAASGDSSSSGATSTLTTSRSSLGLSRMNGELSRNQNNVAILRLPQGPDGSRGFAVKR